MPIVETTSRCADPTSFAMRQACVQMGLRMIKQPYDASAEVIPIHMVGFTDAWGNWPYIRPSWSIPFLQHPVGSYSPCCWKFQATAVCKEKGWGLPKWAGDLDQQKHCVSLCCAVSPSLSATPYGSHSPCCWKFGAAAVCKEKGWDNPKHPASPSISKAVAMLSLVYWSVWRIRLFFRIAGNRWQRHSIRLLVFNEIFLGIGHARSLLKVSFWLIDNNFPLRLTYSPKCGSARAQGTQWADWLTKGSMHQPNWCL